METFTTLEQLVAAAFSSDSETLGNNSGASYKQELVFADKYSFEAHCLDDKTITLGLFEVNGKKRKTLIVHVLPIIHNPGLAPIYANYLWVDFQSLIAINKDLSHININEFAIHLLNGREDSMTDRANSLVSKAFSNATEYAKQDDGVFYFQSDFCGFLFFNRDCLEYYADALNLLPDELKESVAKDIDIDFNNKVNHIATLYGCDYDAVKNSYLSKTKELLELILGTVNGGAFEWALNAKIKLDKAFDEKTKQLVEDFRKPEASNTNEDYKACKKYFTDNPVDVENLGGVAFAEELYDWQVAQQVSFDFRQLACLFYKFVYNDCGFKDADCLLRDQYVCEVISVAYVKPILLLK